MGILDHPSSSGPAPKRGALGVDWASWFPPLSSRSLLAHYLPASGAISHSLYTVHIFSPTIISKVFPTADLAVSNTILFNANVGLGFYVYFRRHLHRTQPWDRVEFSVLTSTLFNFGSLLAAVLIKALLPAKTATWAKSAVAVSLSAYLLSRGYKYLGYLDARTSRGSPSPPRSPGSEKSHRSAYRSTRRPPSSIASSRFDEPRRPSYDAPDSTTDNHQHQNGSTPYSNGSPPRQHNPQPMTPTTTNYSVTESDVGTSPTADLPSTQDPQAPNYRYLHSYALNNINQARDKENIIRRTRVQATPTRRSRPLPAPMTTTDCSVFVTPANSVIDTPQPSILSVLTPPPSRLDSLATPTKTITTPISTRHQHKKHHHHHNDKTDRIIEMVQSHAPLALIPATLACFVHSGTLLPVPVIETLRFIFCTNLHR